MGINNEKNEVQNDEFFKQYKDIKLKKKELIYEVYDAINIKDNRNVCLKVYNKKILQKGDYDFFMEIINREEKIVNLCKSDNILKIYRKLENQDFIIFEKESWEISLADFIEKTSSFDINIFKEILLSIAAALYILYYNGVMHRDIKPSNIFIIQSDKIDKTKIKLGGFDYSIYIKDNTFESVGSYFYAAPEIIKNLEYDEKCDLWSLGITLYELLFGELPYGKYVTINTIKQSIYYQDNFHYKKSEAYPMIDKLLSILLIVNRKNRISHKEFFQFINSNIRCLDIMPSIFKGHSSPNQVNYLIRQNNENINLNKNLFANKLMDIIEAGYLPDIMNFSNGLIESKKIYNNIIYYDENVKFIKSIIKDCEYFEQKTSGAFILCQSLESMKLIREEILRQTRKDKRIIFNLITSGSSCEKLMEFISQNKEFEDIIKNVCIFCKNINKYQNLKNKYTKIHDDIYNQKDDVLNFINKNSDVNIKVFQITKLITLIEYKDKYKDRHLTISEFYGKKNLEKFEDKYYKGLTNLINEEAQNNELKTNKEKLLTGFQSFRIKNSQQLNETNIEESLEYLDKLLITEYTKNTFYGDLNKWLMNFTMNFYDYESVAYFTGRLMYSLNSYALKNQKFFNKDNNYIYRGIEIPYSCLLPYERAKGKIILLTSFTSTSESKQKALEFSGRNHSKELYKTNLLFSVLYIIKNIWKKGWISNGINIQDEAVYKSEKEILYQPFSFYYLSDIQINLEEYTADIYLETVGKTQILENEIKKGKEIDYDLSENIIEIRENEK